MLSESVVDFTIVIPHRGPVMGLWATIESCEAELSGQGFTYNYAVVENGAVEHCGGFLHHLKEQNKLRHFQAVTKPLAPPVARNLAARKADGRYLFFFDSHCVVSKGYFVKALEDFETNPEIDVLHSATRFFPGGPVVYHYCLAGHIDTAFIGDAAKVPQIAEAPYRIAVSGHGGFAVRRDVWRELDGYWGGFRGYGGEEMYFDLKAALMGKSVWLDPRVIHSHFPSVRPYLRKFTEDFYINTIMAANIIGGASWAKKVLIYYRDLAFTGRTCSCDPAKASRRECVYHFQRMQDQALMRSWERVVWLKARRRRTLEEQLCWFKEHGVAC